MHRAVLKCAAPSFLVIALVLVPFMGKAFTMDDTFFLFQARHALVDPLHPTSFDVVWMNVPERVAKIGPTGPLMAWLLVPSVAAGGVEWVAHLGQLAILAAALLATASLALRLGVDPRWATVATLLVSVTPAVLGMAGTAMPDVPAMALGVLGMERLVAWKQEGRAYSAVLATVLLALAPLARSTLLLLPFVGALLVAGDFLALRSWREPPWTRWLPVAAAPLITVALLVVTRDPTAGGGDVLATTHVMSSLRSIEKNTVAFLTHWVLVIPLAIPWVLLRPRAVLSRWWVFLLFTGAAALALARARIPQLYVAPFAGLGATVLWDVLEDGWKRRDRLQLALGLWLLIPLAPAPYTHLPSKYLLAAVPAAALLVAHEMSRSERVLTRAALAVCCAMGLSLGIAILRADSAFAGLGRRAAAELIAPRSANGQRVWFAGHWGFQWYAENAGGRILTLTPPYPALGDLVVTTTRSEAGFEIADMLSTRYRRATHIGRVEDATPGGRVMANGAGFFSNGFGYLPWAWGDEPLDTFDLWRIE